MVIWLSPGLEDEIQMSYFRDAQVREQLERLYQRSPSISFWAQMGEFVRQIGAAMVGELTRDRTMPHISKFYTVEGKALWRLHDPVSGQRVTLWSETDVENWLAQRHAK